MEKKITKAERFSFITKTLIENPSKIFTLQYFYGQLECSKSTISEDVDAIAKLMAFKDEGEIVSVTGAAGGIYYLPCISEEAIMSIAETLCDELNQKSRFISGGYLYTNDIIYNPKWVENISKCMLSKFESLNFDYVVTLETKGIPLAVSLARLLNKKVIVIRKDARLTEGATIQMNYETGTKRDIKTMALPIKMIERGSKVVFVDDFMKAGGTAKGVVDLMKEFNVDVIATAVIMANKNPKNKLINKYYSLLEISHIDDKHIEVNVDNVIH